MTRPYTACGVSWPNRCPKNRNRIPPWNRVAAPAQLPGAQQLRAVALPRVLVAVETGQAAHQEERQADVGVDGEGDGVEVFMPMLPAGWTPGARRRAPIWIGCGWRGLAWPWVEQPPKAAGSSQEFIEGGLVGDLHRLAFSPASSSTAASTLA